MADQLDFFGAPTKTPAAAKAVVVRACEHPPALGQVAARLPAGLRLGTSSWAYPGWDGLVYGDRYPQTRLARGGLAAYAAHPLLRMVGVDRSYYAPLQAAEFADYAASVPPDFRFLVKAHEACTVAVYPRHARYGALRGQPNARFLDPAYATEQVLGPTLEGLGISAGPVLFQFSPMDVAGLGGPRWFAERLHGFLRELPRGPVYAVELRNRELLTGAYLDALVATGVCHCSNVYPGMPSPLVQYQRMHHAQAPAVVVRWMLHPAMRWDQAEAAYAPFDRIVDGDEPRHADVADVCVQAGTQALPVYVVVNNNAEGCAPRTICRLAETIVQRQATEESHVALRQHDERE